MKFLTSVVSGALLMGTAFFEAEARSSQGLEAIKSLVVQGVAGQDQPASYCVHPFKASKGGRPVVFSGLQKTCARLGQAVKVPPGPVMVMYSGSVLFIEKKAAQSLVIQLRNIEVFPSHSAGAFRVWADLTEESEQDKLMLKEWISGKEMFEACVKSPVFEDEQAFQKGCGPYLDATDFRQGLGRVFKFSPTGSVTFTLTLPFSTEISSFPRGLIVAESLAPGAVALLPGAYVIEWMGLPAGTSAADTKWIVE